MENDDLVKFTNAVNALGHRLGDKIFAYGLKELQKEAKKGTNTLVAMNALLRASHIFTADTIATMAFEADGRNDVSAQEFEKKSFEVFSDMTKPVLELVQKHVKAIVIRKGKL